MMMTENYFLRNFFDNVPAQLVVIGADGRYRYVSTDAINNEEIRSWIIGKTDYEYCEYKNRPIEIADRRNAAFTKALAIKSKTSFTETIINEGVTYRFERVYKPVYLPSGELEYVIGYGFNITEAFNTEVSLEVFKEAVENSSEGIAICNPEGNYYYMNSVHAKIFEYDLPEDLYGKSWTVLYEEPEKQRIFKDIFPLLSQEKRWHGETLGVSKYGAPIPQYISLTILPNNDLLCITRDISESLKNLALQTKFRQAIELSGSCIIMLDSKGTLEWANKYFYQISEFTDDAIIGFNLLTFESAEHLNSKRGIVHLLEYNGAEQNHTGKAILTTKAGIEITMLVSITTIFDGSGKLIGYVIVQMDISTMEETQKQILSSLKSVSEINDFKSQLISVVSHELRTPLSAIQIYTEIIKQQLVIEAKEEKYTKYFNILQDQINVMSFALDGFLTLGKINSNNFTVNKRPECPLDLIQKFISSSIFKLQNRKIEFVHNECPNKFPIDNSIFLLILKNLVENALKYSPPISKVIIKLKVTENNFEVSVQDFGLGIPENEQHKIFSEFFRASNSGNESGYGLGLYIVNSLAKLHNAQVLLKSTENIGSTFTVQF
jgi:PAS domain S-box-containing protein